MKKPLLALAAAVLVAGAGAIAVAQDKKEALRPEVGTPLQAAQDLLKGDKPAEALAKIDEADAVADKTPFETYIVNRLRISAALGANDVPSAIKGLEATIASGRLTPTEQLQMTQGLAGAYYSQKEFAKSAQWSARYIKEGGTDPKARLMMIQSYYFANDFATAARELAVDVEAAEKEGKAAPEDKMRLLAGCYQKLDDGPRYFSALESLVIRYPKKEYWYQLFYRTRKGSTYTDPLALDLLRIRLKAGGPEEADDYMDLADSALKQGYPAEAKKAIDRGYSDGVLGTGPEADRHKRLRDSVEKTLANDRKSLEGNTDEKYAEAQKDSGQALIDLGFAYVTNAQYDRGIKLMERGMAKGGGTGKTKFPQDPKLRLGIAYLLAGQKEKALATIREAPKSADIGRLWIVYAGTI
jgi:hypothetical protein